MASWSGTNTVANIFDGSGTGISVANLYATSVSTLRDLSGTGYSLRQYGITASHVELSFDPADVVQSINLAQAAGYANLQALPAASTGYDAYLGYIEGTSGANSQDFSIYPPGYVSTYTIESTSLPGLRSAIAGAEPIVFLGYPNVPMSPYFATPSFGQRFADPVTTVYKDPCVLYLESIGHWLIVLCRVRNLTSGTGGPQPDSSISDIVAYTASDPEFTTAVQGPYWIVSSLNAIPGLTTRLWLGVPSAFEVVDSSGTGGRVYIYYTLDESNLLSVRDPNTLTQIADTGLIYISPFQGSYTNPQGPVPGIGVSIVDAQLFLALPPSEATWSRPTDDLWEDTGRSPRITSVPQLFSLQVPKVFRGMVRLWMARWGSQTNEVVAFEEAQRSWRAVDPVLVCDSTSNPRSMQSAATMADQMALFFATSPRSGTTNTDDGHGIWRATPCTDAMSLVLLDASGNVLPVTYTAQFGVDFVMRGVDFDTNIKLIFKTTDRVIASDEASFRYIDPDPVRLYSASWRLNMGQLAVTAANTPTLLVYVDTTANEDVFVPVADCWI